MKNLIKILIILLAVFIIVSVIKLLSRSEIERTLMKNGRAYFLLIGIDNVDNISRADTVILCEIDNAKSVKLLSVPRDTAVNYLGSRQKLNTIFARGTVRKDISEGFKRVKETLGKMLSVDISRYVVLTYDAFSTVVDMIGGVDVFVPSDMYYIDKGGSLYIDIKKGLNHFDGRRALEYIRFRADGRGDIGRIERQRDFMMSVLKKESLARMLGNPKLLSLIFKRTSTNFSLKEMLFLREYYGEADLKRIKLKTLPGKADGSYWLYSGGPFDKIFGKREEKTEVLVQVLNGTGVTGMGEKAASRIRELGYDVISIGNADRSDYAESVLISFTDEYSDIEKVVEQFNIKHVYMKENEGVYDVQIIIGKDINISD